MGNGKQILIFILTAFGPFNVLAADFYDFRKGPDGGVKREVIAQITDFTNVSDVDLIEEAKNTVKSNVLIQPDNIRYQSIEVVKNAENKKVVCGEVNTMNMGGRYVGFSQFAYGESGLIILKKTKLENASGELGNKIRNQLEQRDAKYKTMGCGLNR